LQGPLAFKPGVVGAPVAVPVPIPVVVPGVVLEIPPVAAIPGEDTPPLTPAELLPPAVPGAATAPPAPTPAPNAQLEDTASAAAITIVVIFMTFRLPVHG
jgi:hypothetical protein